MINQQCCGGVTECELLVNRKVMAFLTHQKITLQKMF